MIGKYFDCEKYKKDSIIPSLEDSEFIECSFEGINLSNESLQNSQFIECRFINCNLSNILVTNLVIRDTTFSDCKMIGINWSSIQGFSNIVYSGSILNLSIFQSLNLSGTQFKNCSLHEVDFSGSKLIKSNFNQSSLNGTIFSDCNLEGADFREASSYQIDLNFTKVKKALFSMPEAMVLLDSFDIIID